MATWTYNGRTYSDGKTSSATSAGSGGSGSSGGGNGLSWRDPNSGTIYYNIDRADSSYQTSGINGGQIPSNATYNPNEVYKASTAARLDPNAPSVQSLYSGNFDNNYVSGNLLSLDPRFTNAQKAMITANNIAFRNNGQPIYSASDIDNAAQGMAGWTYSPGRENYAYVQSHTPGGQNFIPQTFLTNTQGDTYTFRGYANDPYFGAYLNGTQSPTDMEYSWERKPNGKGGFVFDAEGAEAAQARLYKKLVANESSPASKIMNEGFGTASKVDGINNAVAQGTQTTVTLPDGNTTVGYLIEGRTFLPDGSRPPVGSYVQTADGVYQMTDNGGVKVDGVPTTFAQKANPFALNQSNPEEEEYMARMEEMLRQNEEAYIQQQQAMLTAKRDREIAELQRAYEDQVAQGNISVREAEAEFNEQKKLIEQQYYANSQKTALYAQNMGIQNSQQAVGLMQGDDARKAELTQTAQTDYQKRVADVRDRVNAIMRQKNIDIARANSEFDAGMLGAYSTAQLNTSNQMFDLYQSERQNVMARQEAEATRQHQFDMAMYQHQLQLEQMVKAGEISMEQAAVEWERRLQQMEIQFGYDARLANMRVSGTGGSGGDGGRQQLLNEAARLGIDVNKIPKDSTLEQTVSKAQKTEKVKDEYYAKIFYEQHPGNKPVHKKLESYKNYEKRRQEWLRRYNRWFEAKQYLGM